MRVCVFWVCVGGSSDTEKNLVIGKLSEDRGYCTPTGGLTTLQQHTLANCYPAHSPSAWTETKQQREKDLQ